MREVSASLVTPHGASVIEGLRVDSYNLLLRDDVGFVGAHARSKAFVDALEAVWAESRPALGRDPLSGLRSDDRGTFDDVHQEGDPEAVETFTARLSNVASRFLETQLRRPLDRGGPSRQTFRHF